MSSFFSARSVTLATMAAVAVGSVMFLATSPVNNIVVREMVTYNAAVLSFFATLYYNTPSGFESHFNVPQLKDSEKNKKVTLGDVLYYSLVTHASVGYGDIYPLTRQARAAVTAHILLSFAGVANLLLLASKR